MSEFEESPKKKKKLRKISPQRLKNIGLYYLQRFDSSTDNLRQVLQRRVFDYARQVSDFDTNEALLWIEEILEEFKRFNYLNDERYAKLKIQSYLAAGKPERYIKIKLRQKGIDENNVDKLMNEEEYNQQEMAYKFARKKRIGPFRADDEARRLNKQKDMATLIRAGFDYDVVCAVMGSEYVQEDADF